jgi:putative tryptophan/tyrosine transport system substrate-binding protein
MQRRDLLRAIGTGLLWPLAARASENGHVGVLMNGVAANAAGQSYMQTFVQELSRLGWAEGRNLQLDMRWNAGEPSLARTYAADLVALRPQVMLASSTTNLAALTEATHTIPIVFVEVSDPLAPGFVPNMEHPGGNVTGFTGFRASMAGQWLDLLKEIAPGTKRVMIIFNPDTAPQSKLFLKSVTDAGRPLDLEVVAAPVRDAADIEGVMENFSHQPDGAVIVPADTFTQMRRGLFVELAARYRLPAVYFSAEFVRTGGLVSYGFDLAAQFRRAADYVDRILKGAHPGDLPVEQPSKLSLVLNLKAARAMGLQVPAQLIARADEVIE